MGPRWNHNGGTAETQCGRNVTRAESQRARHGARLGAIGGSNGPRCQAVAVSLGSRFGNIGVPLRPRCRPIGTPLRFCCAAISIPLGPHWGPMESIRTHIIYRATLFRAAFGTRWPTSGPAGAPARGSTTRGRPWGSIRGSRNGLPLGSHRRPHSGSAGKPLWFRLGYDRTELRFRCGPIAIPLGAHWVPLVQRRWVRSGTPKKLQWGPAE